MSGTSQKVNSDDKVGAVGGAASEHQDQEGGGVGKDPKNVAELTHYIQSMLQQMQDRSSLHIAVKNHDYLTTYCLGSRRCLTR